MGLATVEKRFQTVLKDFKDTDRSRYFRELKAYEDLPWATPKLVCHGEFWIEMERCTPILNLSKEQSDRYTEPLRELVQRVHDAGWWHCDICLVNVVIHPVRGPLLIDWENMQPANGPVSYDLYGPSTAGVEPSWNVDGGNGVWWGGPWSTCPGPYWEAT